MLLIIAVGLLFATAPARAQSAAPDGTVTRRYPRYPILVVRNETMNSVRVFDQGLQIANVMPGDSAVTVMPGRGTRALTLRTFGSESVTDAFAFEMNRGWTLTITYSGRNWITLRP